MWYNYVPVSGYICIPDIFVSRWMYAFFCGRRPEVIHGPVKTEAGACSFVARVLERAGCRMCLISDTIHALLFSVRARACACSCAWLLRLRFPADIFLRFLVYFALALGARAYFLLRLLLCLRPSDM
jgi:hypothetical protein